MKTENMIGSQFDEWHAFKDSLVWNNNRIQDDNIRATFLEAMRCSVLRHRAFDEVTSKIHRAGKTVSSNVLYKLWHSAECKWKALQHGQGNIQLLPIPARTNGHDSFRAVREQAPDKTPADEPGSDVVVIDGLNVIFGTPSHQEPSLMNLLALLLALQRRKSAFKCFFDASTYFKLLEAGRSDEADAYRKLCYDFPDTFIEVPGGYQADEFILNCANGETARVVSNDRFRDYEGKYKWLQRDSTRRVSFVIYSNKVHPVRLGIEAAIPTDLAAADSALRAGFGKLKLAKTPAETNRAANLTHLNGEMALVAA